MDHPCVYDKIHNFYGCFLGPWIHRPGSLHGCKAPQLLPGDRHHPCGALEMWSGAMGTPLANWGAVKRGKTMAEIGKNHGKFMTSNFPWIWMDISWLSCRFHPEHVFLLRDSRDSRDLMWIKWGFSWWLSMIQNEAEYAPWWEICWHLAHKWSSHVGK